MFARVLLAVLVPAVAIAQNAPVSARVSTGSWTTQGSEVASAALWPHPSDSARSVLLVADPGAGLLVVPLDGSAVGSLGAETYSGVAVREHFPLGGASVTMVSAARMDTGVIELFTLNESLARQARGTVTPTTSGTVLGTALVFRRATGDRYLFVSTTSFEVLQFELTEAGDQTLSGELVRTLTFGSRASQLIADMQTGLLFVAQELQGIWSFDVDPLSGTSGDLVAAVGAPLSAPVGGLALYPASSGGYLLSASPSDDLVHVFSKSGAVTRIGALQALDEDDLSVNAPEAVVVFNRPAGGFPSGLLAAHDRVGDSSRFVLLDWRDVAVAFDPSLDIDTATNPGSPTDGTDGGVDAGGGGGNTGGVDPRLPLPGPSPELPPEEGVGCSCASAPVSAFLLLGWLSALLWRKRRES